MLRLRPYKPCDAESIVKWITDKKMFYQWSADRINIYPLTPDVLNNYYSQFENNPGFWQMTAVDELNNPAGHFIMRYTDDDVNRIRLGFIVVNNNIRGKGYGKEMLLLAEKYAFEILKANEISLGVFANNPRAYYCYNAAGFRENKDMEHYDVSIEDELWECIDMIAYKDCLEEI